jgi:anti-anti-sigma factor
MEIMRDGPVLVLGGALDVRSTMEVRNAVYDLLASVDGDVVVDLSEVDNVDVTALKVLAVASRQAVREGHHLTLRGCPPQVRRMLLLTHLNRLVELDRGGSADVG